MDLTSKVEELIELKKEGEYWDFKKKWYNNKADLLHDIICFANNIVNKDSYIIIGVEDNTYEVEGVIDDDNRKNQQQVIDFLNSKSFISGIRPDVEVRTIKINCKELDIIVIKNSHDTPYFLLEDYRDKESVVRKYSIYTRIKDTNTPKDTIADINQIEYLWKKRFMLTESPIKRIFESLKDKENWERRYIKGETVFYNKFNPEYTIVIEEEIDELYPEFYSMMMINTSQSYMNLNVKYYGTIVYQCQLTNLDGCRLLVPTPEWGFINDISRESTQGGYKYYIIDSYREKLLNFFFDETKEEQCHAKRRFDKVILYFESESQRIKFAHFIIKNEEAVNREIDEEIKKLKHIKCTEEYETNYMKIHIATGIVLNKHLKEFKK